MKNSGSYFITCMLWKPTDFTCSLGRQLGCPLHCSASQERRWISQNKNQRTVWGPSAARARPGDNQRRECVSTAHPSTRPSSHQMTFLFVTVKLTIWTVTHHLLVTFLPFRRFLFHAVNNKTAKNDAWCLGCNQHWWILFSHARIYFLTRQSKQNYLVDS